MKCEKCLKYINSYLNNLRENNNQNDLLSLCKLLTHSEIKEPSANYKGNDFNQMPSLYGSPYWDADNTNIMLAIYCVLFENIKQNNECFKDDNLRFYEYPWPGRVGETLNSFGTMFGSKNAQNRLANLLVSLDEKKKKHLAKQIELFRSKYHTPGNFMPFPGSLNYPTSKYNTKGWNYLGDFFGVKLKIIKENWEKLIEQKSEIVLLNLNSEFFKKFKNGFDEFQIYFYLEKYEELNFNLCDHSGNNKIPNPFDYEGCIKYISNATKIIDYRSEKMAKKLYNIISKTIEVDIDL
ncbi:hypothetical protein [Bacillus altitudinis]|uniref:hypothetical protein n=1 Tax=Bacillus altitudinis TaxID=293387 RepID=UPI0022806FC8|nr:hypothetical protein [Bacillus altitudinis]MCY7716962.1 hypothetical protein [Bacillus altitudinis]